MQLYTYLEDTSSSIKSFWVEEGHAKYDRPYISRMHLDRDGVLARRTAGSSKPDIKYGGELEAGHLKLRDIYKSKFFMLQFYTKLEIVSPF